MNGLNGDLPPQEINFNDINQNDCQSEPINQSNNLKETNLNEFKPPTSCLIINNLVRPFTLTGLKKILSKCGKIVDDKFWINKDKSKCYVMYENEKIAEESREYINSLKWPASNPNTLKSEFGDSEELEDLIKIDKEEKIKLEKERKEMEALEIVKQEERRQKLKEELSKRFNNEVQLGANLNDSNSLNFLNESKLNSNGNDKSTGNKEDADLDEGREKREISPPKNPPTNVLFVTNLVRPFSLNQLKELLSKNGQIIEEKFWIDKIKSKCYAVYESNDDALKSRNYLHGLKWPKSNIKTLRVDFGKLNDVNNLLNINQDKLKNKDERVNKLNNEVKADQLKEEEKHLDQKVHLGKEQDQQEISPEEVENEEIKRPKSPAKNPVSNIVFVRNLSRPFTQAQLKDLLSEDGSFDENRFWIDKIKSKCYMAYENEEIATRTRDRLHGLTWPSGNHRRLIADFASESELESKISLTSSVRPDQPNKEVKEIKEIDEHINRDKNKRHSLNEETLNDKHKDNQKEDRILLDQNLNNNGHQNKRRRESLSPIRNKREHRDDRMDYQDSKYNNSQMQRNNYDQYQIQHQDSPGKLLENLFRKTESKPSIYWIPLNENEVKFRDEKREEEKRRKEEMGRFRINRYDQRYELSEFNGRKRSSPPRRRDRSPYARNQQPRYPPLQQDRYQQYPMDKRPIDKRPMDKRPYRNDRSPIQVRNDYHSPDRRYVDRNRTPNRFVSNRSKYQNRVRSPRSPIRRSPIRRSPNNRRSPLNNRRTPDRPDYADRKRSPPKESRSRSASSNRSSDVSGSSSSSAYSSRTGSNRSSSTNSQRKVKAVR